MLRSSRKFFRINYYVSSLLPVYFLLTTFMFAIHIECMYRSWHIYDSKEGFIEFNCVFYTFFTIFIIAIICLLIVRYTIKDTLNHSKSFGFKDVKISSKYNSGFREFIFSVVLPLMSTFSIDEYPIATLIMIITLQIIIYIFFINSSDLFPNISLVLIGYSFFYVTDNYSEYSKLQYVLGKTAYIDKLLKGENKVIAIKMGNSDYPDNVGVILKSKSKEGKNNGNI